VCPSPIPYGLHAQSSYVDPFRDSFHHHSSYSSIVCSYCQFFDHDVNSCPYYDISNECYARLDDVIETMNERHEFFISEMRECGLLHEIDPSPSSPRPVVNLYDDYESFLPLEPNFMVDAPLTGLEEVVDPPLTSLPFIAQSSSSTPKGITEGVLSVLSFPIPLAQRAGLEMGESSMGDASFIKDDLVDWLGELTLIDRFLEETPFEELCGGGMIVGVAPNIKHIEPICTKSLDLTPISSPCFPPPSLIFLLFMSP